MQKKNPKEKSLRERQKEEAILRMKTLEKVFDLNPHLVQYLEEDRVYYSYVNSGIFPSIDSIEYDERNVEVVRQFVKEYPGSYVYHAIETDTQFGKMLTLLFVSSSPEEWPTERLENNYIFSYVYNFGMEFGELGDVFLSSDCGALVRIG